MNLRIRTKLAFLVFVMSVGIFIVGLTGYYFSGRDIKMLGIIIFVTSLICILISICITLSITKPLNKLIILIDDTSNFNILHNESNQYLLDLGGEIGIIIRHTGVMRRSLRMVVESINNVSNMLASNSGNLSTITDKYLKSIYQVVTAICEVSEGTNIQAEMINNVSSNLSDIAKTIDQVNRIMTVNAENANKSLENVEYGKDVIN